MEATSNLNSVHCKDSRGRRLPCRDPECHRSGLSHTGRCLAILVLNPMDSATTNISGGAAEEPFDDAGVSAEVMMYRGTAVGKQ